MREKKKRKKKKREIASKKHDEQLRELWRQGYIPTIETSLNPDDFPPGTDFDNLKFEFFCYSDEQINLFEKDKPSDSTSILDALKEAKDINESYREMVIQQLDAYTETYQITNNVADYVGMEKIQRIKYFSGNKQQHRYHVRYLTVLQSSLEMRNDHFDHEELDQYVTVILEHADLSHQTNVHAYYETTNALLTFCESVGKGLGIISRGLKRGVCTVACDMHSAGVFFCTLVCHPIETVGLVAQSVADATINLYNKVANLTKECVEEKSLMPIIYKAQNTLLLMNENIKTYLANHTIGEIIEDGIVNITQGVLTGFTYQITSKILVSLGKFLLFLSSRQRHAQKLVALFKNKKGKLYQQLTTQQKACPATLPTKWIEKLIHRV